MNPVAASDEAGKCTPAGALSDRQFMEDLRRQMVRFASLQLSDSHAAEDAVQEALLGAMRNVESFDGRSAFRSWVFAILKNKIADVLRQRSRLKEVSELLGQDGDSDDTDSLFDTRGFWQADERPQRWADPEGAVSDAQFWRVFQSCLDHLPARHARVFMMREFLGLDTRDICSSVGITVSNHNVLMHRARLRLRECLENHWFAGR